MNEGRRFLRLSGFSRQLFFRKFPIKNPNGYRVGMVYSHF
jgi:hypothetical protein